MQILDFNLGWQTRLRPCGVGLQRSQVLSPLNELGTLVGWHFTSARRAAGTVSGRRVGHSS